MLFVPPVGWKKSAPPAPSGPSFNMTAGAFSGVVFGYSDGSGLPAFGSIDAEPIPGHDLIANVSGFSQAITFAGDAVSLLSGLTVWVNGIQYAANFSGWGLFGSDTQGSWSSDGPDYADGNSYFIEIK